MGEAQRLETEKCFHARVPSQRFTDPDFESGSVEHRVRHSDVRVRHPRAADDAVQALRPNPTEAN
jgi:hypothetical protein